MNITSSIISETSLHEVVVAVAARDPASLIGKYSYPVKGWCWNAKLGII
jgi:hypothetical protein